MPRGVYDRTKTKEQREAEKAGKPAKAASKKAASPTKAVKTKASTKKAAASEPDVKAVPKISTSSKLHTTELDVGTKFSIVRDNIATLSSAVHGLTSGTQSVFVGDASVAPVVHLLDSELKANLEVLSSLRREVFGLSETEQQAETEKANTAAEVEAERHEEPFIEGDDDDQEKAPVAAAPAQPGIVPMPPAPPAPAGFPAQ